MDSGQQAWQDTKMARLSLGPRPSTTTVFLRGTRRSRIFTPILVSRRAAGDPLEPLGVLHSTERVVVTAALF